MVWRISDELFETRLVYLIDARGVQGVADLTGRSPRTVRSWLREGRRPSAEIRRSVARQGRRETGPAVQSSPGQPGRVVDPRAAASNPIH